VSMIRTSIVAGVALLTLAACATSRQSNYEYRLDCWADTGFDQCGVEFATRQECMAAQNEMIRGEASTRERGTCNRVRKD